MDIKENVLELIGNTSLVRLNHVIDGCHAQIVGKCEFQNPCCSPKKLQLWCSAEVPVGNGL